MLHDYAVAAYALSPIDCVREDAKKHLTYQHREQIENLLVKLFLSEHLTEAEEKKERSRLITTFWSEYEQFTSKMGPFKKEHIWLDEDIDDSPHLWHKKYSIPCTAYLGRF
jgi:hypothetical protein